MPLRILHCLSHSWAGGGQTVAWMIIKALRQYHPEISQKVVAPPGGIFVRKFTDAGVPVIELPLDTIGPVVFSNFRHLVSEGSFDVIHSHGKGAGFYARLSGGNARRLHTFHGVHLPAGRVPSLMYKALERRLAKKTDLIIAVSRSEREEAIREFHIAPENIRVIPNVVDCSSVRDAGAAGVGPEIESFLTRHTGSFVVTMIARNDPVKNYPLAIETCGRVLKRTDKVAFIFAGIGSHTLDGSLGTGAVSQAVLALDPIDNTAPILARSHLLLITSKKEASPLVVLEAFCLGKPVIGTDVAGIREVVGHERNGLLCPGDAASLAEAIVSLSLDQEGYRLLQEGASAVGRTMNVDSWKNEYWKLYAGGDV
jgi:glycosyltransferase involved in cell wall biosynthesis